MRWLCIEAYFLAGRYHGRSDDGLGHEWPPNPHRLFQALVAAANLGFRRTEFSDAKKAALLWLERRPAPEIVAARARRMNPIRLYVPNNDLDKVARAWAKNVEPEKQPAELRTDKDLWPHLLDGDRTVRFLWPIADDEWEEGRPHAELLCEEARHLHALGLGIDLVAGNGWILTKPERASLSGEVWIADSEGLGSRVPVEGSLGELIGRHRAQAERVRAGGGRGAVRWVAPPAPPAVFREIGYSLRSEPRARPFHAFELVDEDGAFCSFDPRRAIEIAAWLRHAAHEVARRIKLDGDFIEQFVCGHGEDAASKNHRFSYVPLPTIPAKGRDGRIRRVLVVEPFGGGGRKAQAVSRRLSGVSLYAQDEDENGKPQWRADLRTVSDLGNDRVLARYVSCEGARRWGSVTPLVLPGRDDHRSRKAHGLLLKALAQAGYATPVSETLLQAEPVFPGAEMARAYRVPAYLKELPRTHAIITFAEPVQGPVILGGGRHVGLGVFAAMD